jgi:hypothetical protein
MSVIATDTQRYSNVVKYEEEPSLALTREVVIVNDAAKTLKLGMLLGKVTATGKYKEAVETATDGSQNPVAVVIGKDIFADAVTLTADTDTKVLAIVRGDVIVSKAGLLPNASFNGATKLAAAYASLASVGILANDSI